MRQQLLRYGWQWNIFHLAMIGLILFPLAVHAAPLQPNDQPPVRPPTPTPTPDLDPPLLPERPIPNPTIEEDAPPQPERHPCAHIQLRVKDADPLGLWTMVQWQDGEDAWHDVAGWQGPLEAGQKAWWLSAELFGAGPFRWVIYQSPDGPVAGVSQSFWLPDQDGGEVLIEMGEDRDDVTDVTFE